MLALYMHSYSEIRAIVVDSPNVPVFSLYGSAYTNVATATVRYVIGKPHTSDNVNLVLMFIALTLKYLLLESSSVSKIKKK